MAFTRTFTFTFSALALALGLWPWLFWPWLTGLGPWLWHRKISTLMGYGFRCYWLDAHTRITIENNLFCSDGLYVCNWRTGCVKNITGSGGDIRSPNHPNKYFTNRTCEWYIYSSSRKGRIMLIIHEFKMEGNPQGQIVATLQLLVIGELVSSGTSRNLL